eukprot:7832753-Pyramimonas_sp.AAC.1
MTSTGVPTEPQNAFPSTGAFYLLGGDSIGLRSWLGDASQTGVTCANPHTGICACALPIPWGPYAAHV